ncbi:pectate lyase [Alkalicoccobacillus murimartini]|uniref:Pectate lyase n=1 Tax=Alkalicoccobacillus murimartini TaxID=171685 RepID=A0ABT9YJE6_9BACI|nr:pectate lyase [Alkalicoccobacillus murimartini]MDQ0207733.1 pectate lyase [Alkalicoccobacillus murimartini]
MKKALCFSPLLIFFILVGLFSTSDVKANSVVTQAEHLLTWQMDHGGWTKDKPEIYTRDWNGSESKSVWQSNGQDLGTVDNDATVSEILVVAEAYQLTGDQRFLDSAYAGIDFLFKLQSENGGISQVYPERGSDPSSSVWYSNYVTFNDRAMINVLELLEQVLHQEAPFNGDFLNNNLQSELEAAIDGGLDYILQSQIVVNGTPTAWCQQHDPTTYEPMPGRAYEHVSISGDESVSIVEWLQARPNPTPEVTASINYALDWFEEATLTDTRYERQTEPHFFDDAGTDTWARFYEIGTNRPIFSGRDGIVRYDIMDVEQERRYGYAWAGQWPQRILE